MAELQDFINEIDAYLTQVAELYAGPRTYLVHRDGSKELLRLGPTPPCRLYGESDLAHQDIPAEGTE